MNEYELGVYEEVLDWKRKITRKSRILTRLSKKAQVKMNEWIPEKIQRAMTESIKAMVKATLWGAQIAAKRNKTYTGPLETRDELARKKIDFYQRTAIIEGAGTGVGGGLLSLADFPLLLTIKIQFLFEIASIYGYDTNDYMERLFILHIFQLAFSGDDTRKETLTVIENWEHRKAAFADMDWHKFQQEYRDYIDLAKLFQLIPGIGAFVGAYANKKLLNHLGEMAINSYRMRILTTPPNIH